MNKKLLYLLLTTSVIFYIICCNLYTDSPIKLSAGFWNFGTVLKGTTIYYNFDIYNESKSKIKIFLRTDCECIYIKQKNFCLKPQSKENIKLKFYTDDYSGKINKYVYIHTDDMNFIILPVTGKIIKKSSPVYEIKRVIKKIFDIK